MRLGGGLGGDSRLPKEPRKKILAEAAARGVAAPPSADDRGIRYSTKVWGTVLTTAGWCGHRKGITCGVLQLVHLRAARR